MGLVRMLSIDGLTEWKPNYLGVTREKGSDGGIAIAR